MFCRFTLSWGSFHVGSPRKRHLRRPCLRNDSIPSLSIVLVKRNSNTHTHTDTTQKRVEETLAIGPLWHETQAVTNSKRFALPASAQPSLREGSGTPKSSVGKVRILLKACDRTSSPVLVRCSEAVLLGRFESKTKTISAAQCPWKKRTSFWG